MTIKVGEEGAAGSVDCLHIDATRCGGYMALLRAAAAAQAQRVEVSAHCAPSLHVPVAASAPNLRHVEYFHDHARCNALPFTGLGEVCAEALHPRAAVSGHEVRVNPDRASHCESVGGPRRTAARSWPARYPHGPVERRPNG